MIGTTKEKNYKLAFIRHGKTQWNLEKRFQGRTDIPLLESTKNQWREIALHERFRSFDFYSSPLQRAQQTLQCLGLEKFKVAEELIECDFGDWEGQTLQAINESYTPLLASGYSGLDYKDHRGESMREVQNRVIPWLLKRKSDSFIVAHKALITAVYAHATGWEILAKPKHRLEFNRKVHLFNVREGRIELDTLNIPV